jgi:beta-galactosidase/beta-glucuronidase
MRIFLSILVMSLSLMAVEKFSIEVLSVPDKNKISDAFMQKVISTNLAFTTHHSEGTYRVLVGDFTSIQEAKKTLPLVQEKINKKAFITMGMDVVEINPQEKMIQAMIMAQAKALKNPNEKVTVETQESVEIKDPDEELITKQSESIMVKKEDEEVFCTSSKKALREAQIGKALAFYRNSSYYSFSH